MKLGIYAHQRSGSSILYEIMADRCGGTPLGECFNPNDDVSLVETTLYGPVFLTLNRHDPVPESQVQTRDERLSLMQVHNKDSYYFIKVFGTDMRHEGIREYVRENYELVAIERRNSFSAVLSGIVAIEHWYFNDGLGFGPRPVYKPFLAKYQHFSFMADALLSYYKHKDSQNIRMTYVYEDLIKLDQKTILQQLNLGETLIPTLPLRKLLNFKAKVDLIQNYEEVLYWYKTGLEPFLPEDRRGGY